MPFTKISDGHVEQQVSTVLMADMNPIYVADQILPTVPNLKKRTGLIASLGSSHLRTYSSKRSLWDASQHRIGFDISNDDTYKIEDYDLSCYVPDKLQEELDAPFDAASIAGMTTLEALKLEREVALAAAMTSTSILSRNQTNSGTSQYNDPTSAPLTDFDTARDSVQGYKGFEANAMFMSRKVMNALRRHPDIIAISQAAMTGGASKETALSPEGLIATLKAWFELDYVIIGRAIKITSAQGQATVTKGAVWGNDVVFFYRPTAPALMKPSFGYSFQLAGGNMTTKTRREPIADKGDLVEVAWGYQDNILDSDAAYLIKDAVA